MADEDFTPITGVDDDPAAGAFADDEAGQSLIPTPSDRQTPDPPLEGQSVEPLGVDDDPAALNDFGRLDDIGQLARTITEDPIPLVVAQIHEEIQQLLRLHRDIYDGIELATDQVQDKRIEFLEAGPEVTVADVFFEFALAFFLASPAYGLVLRQAFRFAGNVPKAVFLANRAAKLKRLGEAAQRARGRLADNARKASRISTDLRKNRELQGQTRNVGTLHALRQEESRLLAERRRLDNERRELSRVQGQSETSRQQTEVKAQELKAFFEKTKELRAQYGLAAVAGVRSASAKAKQIATPVIAQAAPDTVGVQIKALAQVHLRDMELYLGLAAADADLLRSIAQSDPFLAPDCFDLLSEMLAILQRANQSGRQKPLDVKRTTALEFEKLIWALLLVESFPDAFEVEDTSVLAILLPGVPSSVSVGTEPSPQYMDYLRNRFFGGLTITDKQVFEDLKKLKEEFDKVSEGETLFDVTSLIFKKDSDQSQSPPTDTSPP